MKEYYLDNASTTKVDKKVVSVMNEFMLKEYGNPSSVHSLGENARKEIERVRKEIASEIGCKAWEIIFNSGTSEGNNHVLKGLSKKGNRNKILVSEIEHPSVLECERDLREKGFKFEKIKVDENGFVKFSELMKKIDSRTLLVSIMHVNNEIGTIQDIKKIGEYCREKKVLFHVDTAQSFGKIRIDVNKMKIDFLTAGAHKINGPKGIGFLYVREGVKLKSLISGGNQERKERSGTENVPGIVGFGKALEIIKKINRDKVKIVRDELIEELERIGGKINGDREKRIWNNVNVSFPGLEGESMAVYLSEKKVYVSTGSACANNGNKNSYVLRAIGLNKKEIESSLRITLGSEIKMKDVKQIVERIGKVRDILEIK